MRIVTSESNNGSVKETQNKLNKSNLMDNNSTSNSSPKKNRLRPLRILIVEPKGRYCKTVWCSIAIGITHLMLGATIMTTLMYSIKTGDAHVSICTIAYHFFSAEAILCLNYANGWSSPLRLRHRRFAHVFLQMFALVCAVTGAALITIAEGVTSTAHGITGIITTTLAAITFLSGPCVLFGAFGGRYSKLLHVSVGLPTFLISSVCLCCGTFTSAFREWAGDSVVFILTAFVIFYTSFIIISCFIKCVMMI